MKVFFLVYSTNKKRKRRDKKNVKRKSAPVRTLQSGDRKGKVEIRKEKSAVRSQRTLTLKPTVGTVFNVLPATRRKKRVVFPAASRPTRSTRRCFLDLYRAHPCPIFVGAVVVIDVHKFFRTHAVRSLRPLGDDDDFRPKANIA